MWTIPIVGRGLSLVQRTIRIGLRWYINPIVDQINDFNEATVTALNTLAARQEALAARVAALESGDGPNPPAPFPNGEGGAGEKS
jgi:cell division protein FtsB